MNKSKEEIFDILDSYIFSTAIFTSEEIWELGRKKPYSIEFNIRIFLEEMVELDDTL